MFGNANIYCRHSPLITSPLTTSLATHHTTTTTSGSNDNDSDGEGSQKRRRRVKTTRKFSTSICVPLPIDATRLPPPGPPQSTTATRQYVQRMLLHCQHQRRTGVQEDDEG